MGNQARKEQASGNRHLDLAGVDHLLSEVVLVLADGTIPSADSLVLAHHDVFGNLVQESR